MLLWNDVQWLQKISFYNYCFSIFGNFSFSIYDSKISLKWSSVNINFYACFEYFLRSPRGGITGLEMDICKAFHTYCLTILWKVYTIFTFWLEFTILESLHIGNIKYFLFAWLCHIYFSVREFVFSYWCKLLMFRMSSIKHIFPIFLIKNFPSGIFEWVKVGNYFLRTIHNSNMYLQNRVNICMIINMGRMRHSHPILGHSKLQT